MQIDDYVTDVLLRDLVGHDRKPVAFLLYLWLASEQTRRKGAVDISYQELAESIGVSKSSVQSAAKWLAGRRLIAVHKATVTSTPSYKVLTPWRDKSRGGSHR